MSIGSYIFVEDVDNILRGTVLVYDEGPVSTGRSLAALSNCDVGDAIAWGQRHAGIRCIDSNGQLEVYNDRYQYAFASLDNVTNDSKGYVKCIDGSVDIVIGVGRERCRLKLVHAAPSPKKNVTVQITSDHICDEAAKEVIDCVMRRTQLFHGDVTQSDVDRATTIVREAVKFGIVAALLAVKKQ